MWDADAVRDDLRTLITGRLGGPDGVLVVDETGDLKNGTHTVGVRRRSRLRGLGPDYVLAVSCDHLVPCS